MEERDFFDERQEKKPATLNCPHCHQPAEYDVTWVVRTKKRQLAGRADERDRARFAKARSYMHRIAANIGSAPAMLLASWDDLCVKYVRTGRVFSHHSRKILNNASDTTIILLTELPRLQ
jgi:hypothetical protein